MPITDAERWVTEITSFVGTIFGAILALPITIFGGFLRAIDIAVEKTEERM